MYLTLAKAGKEVVLVTCQMETVNATNADAQAIIWEKNTLQLKLTKLKKKLNETKTKLGIANEAPVDAERTKMEDVAMVHTGVMKEYKAFNEF